MLTCSAFFLGLIAGVILAFFLARQHLKAEKAKNAGILALGHLYASAGVGISAADMAKHLGLSPDETTKVMGPLTTGKRPWVVYAQAAGAQVWFYLPLPPGPRA